MFSPWLDYWITGTVCSVADPDPNPDRVIIIQK
jgi:hypothetical protein